MTPQHQTAHLDGLDVRVYRSAIDGRLIVDIETTDLDPSDEHDGAVPNIVVYVNESRCGIAPDGSWIEETSR